MKKTFKNTLIVLVLFICIAGSVLPKPLGDLDEVWNYNFARVISNGFISKDKFDIISTRLVPLICGTILKLTSDELIVMRLLATLLIAFIFFSALKILKMLKINTYIANICLILMFFLYYDFFCIDYNYAILLITLITIYFEIKNTDNHCFAKNFWSGVLVGCSFLIKQTTGLVLILIFVLHRLLLVYNKEDIKKIIKTILYRAIGVLIPFLICSICLIANNMFKEYLNYMFYSVKTFSNSISYILLLNGTYGLIVRILSILVPISILIMYYFAICKKIKTEFQQNIYFLFCYSVASFVVVYPISDKIHFLIGATPCFIAIFYMMYVLICKIIEKYSKAKKIIITILKILGILAILVTTIISGYKIVKYMKIAKNYKNIKHFKYIQSSENNIREVDKFIINQNNIGNNVYILDPQAAIYMIPLDKYNEEYDMFLKGNLGPDGEEGEIQKVQNEDENTIVLILNKNYNRNWQIPTKVIEYIEKNWNYKGIIEQFDIYTRDNN